MSIHEESNANTLSTVFGDTVLQRIPDIPKAPLRAWDAADELLLNHLADQQLITDKPCRILLVNDAFGALACQLDSADLQSWSDSYIAHLATDQNRNANQCVGRYSAIPSTQLPGFPVDIVLIKLPKTLALLEHQLALISAHIDPSTTVIAAGMAKYIQRSHLALFEKYIGTTTTSLAKKKSRLIFSSPDVSKPPPSPYPSQFYCEELDLTIHNHANVFARDKLDIGARFMLQQFDQLPAANSVVDLGCGNGVLGIMAQQKRPDATIHFVDESYMAVASSEHNYRHVFGDTANAHFWVSNCLDQVALKAVDLVLCNPPFHQQHAIGDHIAWQMFKQSRQLLAKHGELWVIGNRHLNYHVKLKRLFNHCGRVNSNHKFVVLAASSC